MYNEAPFEEITLDEFELVALDRLQVLRRIEDLKVQEAPVLAMVHAGGWGAVWLPCLSVCVAHSSAGCTAVPGQ